KIGIEIPGKDCIQIKPGGPNIIIALLIILIGCAGNYGRLVRDYEANKIFKSYQILPGYRYYYIGPEGRPDAIMGIHPDYALETTQWTETDLIEDKLKKLVDWINFHNSNNTRYYPDGFLILDHDGRQVGIWYSIWDWTTVIVEENKRIMVYPPLKDHRFGNGDERERMQRR
ncbi:MAG: hypothetical protein ACYSR9_02500, partial [Planctomycetota bacterium]